MNVHLKKEELDGPHAYIHEHTTHTQSNARTHECRCSHAEACVHTASRKVTAYGVRKKIFEEDKMPVAMERLLGKHTHTHTLTDTPTHDAPSILKELDQSYTHTHTHAMLWVNQFPSY